MSLFPKFVSRAQDDCLVAKLANPANDASQPALNSTEVLLNNSKGLSPLLDGQETLANFSTELAPSTTCNHENLAGLAPIANSLKIQASHAKRLDHLPILAVGHQQIGEMATWPPPTQMFQSRVAAWARQTKGLSAMEAEAVAWATVKELMRRIGGPIIHKSDLPLTATEAINLAIDVFGPDVKVSWDPSPPEE